MGMRASYERGSTPSLSKTMLTTAATPFFSLLLPTTLTTTKDTTTTVTTTTSKTTNNGANNGVKDFTEGVLSLLVCLLVYSGL